MSYMGKVRPTIALTSSDIEDNAVTSSKIIADAVTTVKILDSNVTTAKMATDPTNADNLSSGDVPLAQLGNVPASDTSGLEDDVALLGFKVASNGSLAKYNLVDQTVDAFEDASGVNAGSSTNEDRNASNYYSGIVSTAGSSASFSTVETTSWSAPVGLTTVTYLVVAGGGGGGRGTRAGIFAGGGGGAGGMLTGSLGVTGGSSYTVTVGVGGTGNAATGGDGGNSVFSSITSTGGGGGGGSSDGVGRTGGSGGGGGEGAGAAGTAGQGNAGGAGTNADNTAGGGGGGKTGAGAVGSSSTGGAGGAGEASSITGGSVTYAGGGGGAGGYGATSGTGGAGGSGGGGAGAGSGDGTAGTVNTGGGGGGGSGHSSGTGGNGGSGKVVVKWVTYDAPANLTLVSTTTAAQAEPTKGDIVLTYTNGAGTTTLDTDLTAEISADGGSTWTALALASEGSTGSHNIATSHDVTISSTITAPYNMAYRIKTLNQGASKQTRIQAVSLGWS